MKHNWKRLTTLLLAAILMLSLSAVSEEGIAIDNDLPVLEDIELSGTLNDLDLPVLDIDLQEPVNDEIITPEENTDAEVASNALVTKVKIGVKEKYTIDTSSLSGKLTFASSKKSVATVSKKGVITGKKVGTAKITIKTSKGKKHTVTVTVAKAPSKVTLNKNTATLEVGDTLQLKATLPSKTASNKITWTSSNKNVATVSDKGRVTAKGEGTATITVKTYNGKKATCKVTVEEEETPEQGYTGEIMSGFGENVYAFSNALEDHLSYYKYDDGNNIYANDYMMIFASYTTDTINTIGLFNNTSGKYTLCGIHPGMGFYTAQSEATSIGWTYYSSSGNSYFYRARYKGVNVVLVIAKSSNSLVDYVTMFEG